MEGSPNMFEEVSETQSMRYDVMGIKNGFGIFQAYPELEKLPSWERFKGDRKVLFPGKVYKYLVLVYSKDSILNKKPMPSLTERKYTALKMAGFDQDKKGNFDKKVKDRLIDLDVDYRRGRTLERNVENQVENIIEMILDFVIHQGSSLWQKIVVMEEHRETNIREFGTKISRDSFDSDKDFFMTLSKQRNCMDDVEWAEKRLEEYYTDFFNQDSEIKLELNGRIELTEKRKLSMIEGHARYPVGR